MKCFLILILVLLTSIVEAQTPQDQLININDLEGKWYINQSNFPMWLKGDRISPSFNYTVIKQKENFYLLDEVSYLKKGKIKYIKGIDKPTNNFNTAFVWRGKGMLHLLKSKWTVLHFDKQQQWAIIYFEKTLFTPAGYDVISRNEQLSPSLAQEVDNQLKLLGIQQLLVTLPLADNELENK